MIDKIHRIIYIGSLAIMGLFLLFVVLGRLFFDDFRNSQSLLNVVGFLALATPFAPVGTLFGTLKENQSTRKKITIIICTGFSVLFLMVFIWGAALASTLA
jgi:ABC-type Na+ efflux pump permease subunit